MLSLLCIMLYANNTTKNYNNPGTKRAIQLSHSFCKK